MHALTKLWSSAPHVNYQGTNHHDGNNAKCAFPQRFVSEKLTDVGAGARAEQTLQPRFIDAGGEQVTEAGAGG